MSKKELLTAEELKKILDYNPETGVFMWRQRKKGRQLNRPVGSPNAHGYLQIMINGKNYRASRLAWLYMEGKWPDGEIDHINGDPSDNRYVNLRQVTHAENVQNTRKLRRDNSHGFRGVTKRKDRKKDSWVASIVSAGERFWLGTFDTPEEAHQAYLEAKRKLHAGWVHEISDKKSTYSYSKLEMYEKCPWAYKQIYLERIPRAETEALSIGKQCHSIIAGYLEHLIRHKLPTDWEWVPTVETTSPEVLRIWEQFRNSFVLPSIEDPHVEVKLAFTRSWQQTGFDAPNAYFRMVIDWAYRQGRLGVIQDWKTNWQVPQTVEKDLQLLTYGWGLKQALYPDVQEVLLRLHFLRYGKEREILLTPDDLAHVPEMLEEKIMVIEKDKHFDPTPGSFCGLCGVTAHCPVMATALVPAEVTAPVTREQAEKAAALLLTLQKMEKELAARLKEWVKAHGPVQVGDMVYGPTTITTYDLDTRAVVEFLLNEGLDREAIWPLLNLTKSSLERGLKKLRRLDLLEQVLSLSDCKTSERIDFRKVP